MKAKEIMDLLDEIRYLSASLGSVTNTEKKEINNRIGDVRAELQAIAEEHERLSEG